MARQNLSYHLVSRPRGHIEVGNTFEARTTAAPTADELQDGNILVEALYLSLDPAMRGWLNDTRSYMPPVGIGEVMRGWAISRVLASRNGAVRAGDVVNAATGWREVAIVDRASFEKVSLPAGSRVTDALGVLGLTGLTAYFGLDKIGRPRAGDTVVVSGAAGATGSVAVQIAKLGGARVVGIAGSDDKCAWLRRELGCDVALNYRSASFRDDLVRATPNFIDVYFDNVGGEILELALDRAAFRSRFVMCGSISGYNSPGRQAHGIRNLFHVTAQRIRMEGFIVFDFADEYARARHDIGTWLSEGKLKRKETIYKGGLQVAERALRDLFDGKNTGKLLVEVKPYDQEAGGSHL